MNMTENISSYKDFNLTRLKALYEYAKDLYNGKDINVGGDDYTQAIDDDKRLKAHKIVSSLYNEIAPYKKEILSDIKKYEEQHPHVLYRYGEPYDMLSTLTGIIQWYEEEAQYILDIETGENAPSKELLDFIIFKNRTEFSALFQTIINNRISDGLERAAITYIIYKSSMFNSKKYHEWKPFYMQFCEDTDWKVTTYKPYRLTDTINSLKSKYFWVDAIK